MFMEPGDSTGTGAGDANPRATKPPNDGDGQCVFASFWGIGQKDVAACDSIYAFADFYLADIHGINF